MRVLSSLLSNSFAQHHGNSANFAFLGDYHLVLRYLETSDPFQNIYSCVNLVVPLFFPTSKALITLVWCGGVTV